MDIGHSAFPLEALKILQEVSESHFIAFDLEFSGVASRRPAGTGKLSLQEYYDDIKAAAEKYQILQVGFTIVKEDLKKGRYVARPYNFNISPLTSLRERHFGREWSYHSGAIAFLTRNGFKFDLPISSGVQYLSRSEEQNARQNMVTDEESRSKIADMDLKPEDDILIQHIRYSVRKWQAQPKELQEEFLNVPAEEPGLPTQLTRYQVRLTHQVVRNEYPSLTTTGMGHFVQITNPTEDQQESQKLAMVEKREKDIAGAVGFRWIIEGITGGNILDIPNEYIVAGLPTVRLDGKSPKEFLQTLQQKLKARPRVLIGHNCFTDFVNLYKCFIGPLPNTVEQFASSIHDLFPGVVDTKNLASFGHKRWGNTSLEGVEMDLRSQELPKIHVPTEYDRYVLASKYHEAGYDSLLTAKIAIKLCAKLECEREYLQKPPVGAQEAAVELFGADEDEFHETISGPPQGNLESVLISKVNEGNVISKPPSGPTLEMSPEPRSSNLEAAVAVKQPGQTWLEKDENDKIKSSLRKTNIYDVLEADQDPHSNEQVPFGSGFGVEGEPKPEPDAVKLQEKGAIMPLWDNKMFWTIFGNKLQVNGSKEGICKLE